MFAAALILFSLSGFLENTLQHILWPFLLRRFRQLPSLQIMQDFNFPSKLCKILIFPSKLCKIFNFSCNIMQFFNFPFNNYVDSVVFCPRIGVVMLWRLFLFRSGKDLLLIIMFAECCIEVASVIN